MLQRCVFAACRVTQPLGNQHQAPPWPTCLTCWAAVLRLGSMLPSRPPPLPAAAPRLPAEPSRCRTVSATAACMRLHSQARRQVRVRPLPIPSCPPAHSCPPATTSCPPATCPFHPLHPRLHHPRMACTHISPAAGLCWPFPPPPPKPPPPSPDRPVASSRRAAAAIDAATAPRRAVGRGAAVSRQLAHKIVKHLGA